MKKLFLVALVAVMGFCSIQAEKQVYAELVGYQGFFNPRKITIQVDFGQKVKFAKQGCQFLVDNTGKSIKFHSMTDGLNYMGDFGWKFIQAYVVTSDKQNVYHYMMTKKVDNDNDVYNGIMTKEMYTQLY